MGSILLVEDAPQVAGILASKLRREGHQVSWARSRGEALEVLGRASFDLVLLSTYLLPEKNAWELLGELRRREPPERVVMILEAEEASEASRARELGACGIVQKPFKPTAVARSVRELLPA